MLSKYLRNAIILALCLIHFFCEIPEELREVKPYWLCAAIHPFFHANIFHLLVNCFAISNLFSPKSPYNVFYFLGGYLISFVAFAFNTGPTIGFSNVLCACIGLLTPSLTSKWWTAPTTLIFFAALIGTCFIPNVSFETHIAAFIIGFIVARAKSYIKKVNYDARRYKSRCS